MFGLLKRLWQGSPVCSHSRNYKQAMWTLEDGTLMQHFECCDCDFKDTGHVYGEPSSEWNGTAAAHRGNTTVAAATDD